MRFFAFALATTAALSAVALPASAANLKPSITTQLDGRNLHVTIHGVTDYCEAEADTQIFRTSDTIRIVRERPHHVSRCLETKDLTFVIEDVDPGRYYITYERMPAVAPLRPIRVARTMATIG